MGAPTRKWRMETSNNTTKMLPVLSSEVVNEIMVKLATQHCRNNWFNQTCMAGVCSNCVANGHILSESPVEEIFIQPAAGDNGGAKGFMVMASGSRKEKLMETHYTLPRPEYSIDEMRRVLDRYGAVYHRKERTDIMGEAVRLLADAQVVGLHQGRMEWGPRAFGHRSILGDPRHPEMRKIINAKIKM